MSLSGEREEGVPASKMSLSGEHDSKAKSPIKQERPASPVPSCVSMKSDWSMEHPIEFREGDFSTEQRYKDNVARLVNRFHILSQTGTNRISSTTRGQWSKMSLSGTREEGGPASKISLSGGNDNKAKSPIKQERPASPVPSCVPMKSDKSMDPPIWFREGDFSNEQRYKGNVAHLVNRAEFQSRRQNSTHWISSTTRYTVSSL
ncbi:uncharacterized protein LOC118938472 [Oncorhynchus mykiss]|uniref:uncharacterized protein LOC118938472 n=1 Tax=Oncorhynchus mykiss TaxID=8022 RepID=UPI0018784EDA|nr:uncharacterized protein LOC118938472 [Oncorhynchus mykiss]